MKVAVTATEPTLDSDIDPRFGRARFLIIVDDRDGACEVIDNREAGELPHGAGIAAVETLVRRGVKVVLTGQVGPKAEQGLRAAGIEARVGATGSCRAALKAMWPDTAAGAVARP